MSVLVLLTLPIAAPATAPIPAEVRWDSAPALVYRVQAGDTLASVAGRALGDPGQVKVLAAANGLSPNERLRAGQRVSIPSNLLRRDMLTARVTAFSGQVRTGDGLPLAVGSALLEGDVIETGAHSFVTLDMGGAGRMTLPSQSRLRIAALHRVALTGRIERRLEPMDEQSAWALVARRESAGNGRKSG